MTQTKQRRKRTAIEVRFTKWIRLYVGVRNDRKILALSDRQKWQWIVLLTVAGETEDGVLPPASLLCHDLRCTADEAARLIDDLVLAGLLDVIARSDDGVVVKPHNWDSRQFRSDNSTERSRKCRERKRQQADATDCNVAATNLQRSASDYDYDSVPEDRLDTEPRNGTTLSVGGTRVAARTGGRINRYALAKNGGDQ